MIDVKTILNTAIAVAVGVILAEMVKDKLPTSPSNWEAD